MNAKRFSLLVVGLFVFFATKVAVNAQGTPHYPSPVKPGNGVKITDSNNVEFCVTPNDPGQSQVEVFQGPIPDINSGWKSENPACWTFNLPNGHYTWHTRGKNSVGEGGASPDLTFTVQVGNQEPPTRVPGPENATAVPEPGPSFQLSFNPGSDARVGSSVTIHVQVNSSNPGATKISVGCGGVDKTETSEVSFDSYWNTSGCSNGDQTVTVCARSVSDQQWTRANCQSPRYHLTGDSPAGGPTADFSADSESLQVGQCTNIHWRTNGANSVNIDGENLPVNGDRQECPRVTKKYSLRASNGNSALDATRNFTIQVSNGNIPPASSSSNGGGPQVGPAQNNQVPSNARQGSTPGGVDLIVYCYAKGFTNAGNDNSSANGWYCSGPQFWRVNWGQVCFDVYGSNYTAINPNNTRDGWRCVTGNGSNSNSGNTSSNLQPQQTTNQTNALGQPMEVRPNGDLVYPKASGNGGDLCVHGDVNSLYLRTTPDTGSKANIIGTMTAGDCYQLIQISNGWAQVSTSLATGWVKANPEWVTVTNQSPVIQPTFTPVSQKQPDQQNGGQIIYALPCGELGFAPPRVSKPGDVYAAEQCVAHVRHDPVIQGFYQCLWDHGWHSDVNTGAVAAIDAARRYPQCSVSVHQGNELRLGQLSQSGKFLMVWSTTCGADPTYGHVGIFVDYNEQNQMLTVDESNVNGYSDGIHGRSFPEQYHSCVTFIQLAGSQAGAQSVSQQPDQNGGQQPTQGQGTQTVMVTTASRVGAWVCVLCVPRYSVEFKLPSWHYDLNNFRLLFLGREISWESKGISWVFAGTDGYTFVVSSASIQDQINQGNGDKLSDTNNWQLYYVSK